MPSGRDAIAEAMNGMMSMSCCAVVIPIEEKAKMAYWAPMFTTQNARAAMTRAKRVRKRRAAILEAI